MWHPTAMFDRRIARTTKKPRHALKNISSFCSTPIGIASNWKRPHVRRVTNTVSTSRGSTCSSFPSNARLLSFDIFKFVARLGRKYKNKNLHGVTSKQRAIRRIDRCLWQKSSGYQGLTQAIIAAQHKYIARRIVGQDVPEANVKYCGVSYTFRSAAELGSSFRFRQAGEGGHSVLARRVDTFSQLPGPP